MKKTMKKSNNNVTTDPTQKYDLKWGIKACVIIFIIFLFTQWLTIIIEKGLNEKLLWKLYTMEEIQKDDLRIIPSRSKLKVSNGDILPQGEFRQYVFDLWTRILFVWLIIIVSYFLLKKPAKTVFLRFYGKRKQGFDR